tara:strand:+ start:4124 stop:5026 length:903 start_codon:yes stop_codon:yes gene_type:complete
MIDLIKGDCLIESDKIKSGSVDLILTDLPYGTVKDLYKNSSWDVVVDTEKIYKVANRILRKNGKMILFCQEPFTTELKNKALPNISFNQRLIWEKDNSGNMLFAKKACVNFYEDVLVFSKKDDPNDGHEAREYFKKQRDLIKHLSYKQMSENLNSKYSGQLLCNKLSSDKKNWQFPNKKNYEMLQQLGICKKDYQELKKIGNEFKKKFASTFNLWEGNKFKSNILKYKRDYTGHHTTQKPVLLLEDLIKTFSNENDLVVDLTMGSGSTGVACKNTNRNFIGIELDENYFNIAKERIGINA